MPRRPRVDILYREGRKPLDPLCGLFGTVDYKIGGGNVDDCDVKGKLGGEVKYSKYFRTEDGSSGYLRLK